MRQKTGLLMPETKTAYLDFVPKGEPKKIERFYSLTNLPAVLGSDSYKLKWR
jgi:predicted nucleic acid-binding OB-fold protein